MKDSSEGDQLSLALRWEHEPWLGVSPRALTKAWGWLVSRRELAKAREVFVDPEQLEFWPVDGPVRRKGPRGSSPGASLLVEPSYEEEWYEQREK